MFYEYYYLRRKLASYLTLEVCKMPSTPSDEPCDWFDLDEELEIERPCKIYKDKIADAVDGGKDIFAHDYKVPEALAISNQAHMAKEYDGIVDTLRRHGYCLYPQKEGWADFDFEKVAQIIGADGLAGLVSAIYQYGQDKFQEGYLDAKAEAKKNRKP